MRGFRPAFFACAFSLLPGLAFAAAATPTPTPAASPAATATPVSTGDDGADALPTMTEDDPVPPPPKVDPEWGQGLKANGVLLGLRIGFHTYQPQDIGYGGFALEATAAMPVMGSFYGALVAGYHTGSTPAGHDEPDPEHRYFDTQFGALEGQYRQNVGRVNVIGAFGLGFVNATSAEVTLEDGSPGQATGSGGAAHVMAGAFVPVGRIGVVGQIRYAFAPVQFKDTDETLGMGGLTISAGVDVAF